MSPHKTKEPFHRPIDDSQFLFHAFFSVLEKQKEHPLVKLFDLQREARFSYLFDLSGIQESFRFRALSRARAIATHLVDEKGGIKKEFLKELIAIYEREGMIFYPGGSTDSTLHEHILNFLRLLDRDNLMQSIRRFQSPLCHQWAAKLVEETLGLQLPKGPTDAHIRRAVLCACMTPLRQNVGSCFATAPAILIQKEQVHLLIDDLYQLLSTGKLKRTFGGVEYAIPLSPSTGMGDLKKNLIAGDSKARGGFSPGLIAALISIDALTPDTAFEEQAEALQELIRRYAEGKNYFCVEDLIQKVLLERLSLTEGDLKKSHQWELTQLKSAKLMNQLPDLGISRRLEQVHSFRLKEKQARSVFKGFCDNALLKAWEFTLASFSEVKMEFSRWNLYSSLGLDPKENGGIGQVIYQVIDEKIQEVNQKIEEYQKQYEIAFDQVRATEALLRNASSESDARRLSAEHQSRVYHMRSCLDLRDKTHAQGSHYSTLFSFLVKQYDQKFPEYFQEIYDAEMQDFQGSSLYDDSPAGFRLVYKHGRVDPSLWTLIYNADQYIDALLDFFSVTESQIASECEWEEGDKEILTLTSAIIIHLRSHLFLETALQRMAKAHLAPIVKSPLKNLQSLEKKPWAYTSGGTVTTLLKTYYCRESEFFQEEKWVESESELMVFILDVLKNLSPKILDPFVKLPQKGMLMTSPSHAFILLPGQKMLQEGWKDEIFTYTWVRDQVSIPGQQFYTGMKFTAEEQRFLLEQFCEQLPPLLSHHLNQAFYSLEKKISIQDWRNSVLEAMFQQVPGNAAQKQSITDGLDAFLYQTLPLTKGKDWKIFIRRILSDRMNETIEDVLKLLPEPSSPWLTARQISDMVKGCYLLSGEKTTLSFDLHEFVANQSRVNGKAQPSPVLFADTNWTNYFFGFVINPGNLRLELWRLDKPMSQGVPMSQWRHWLNGSDRKVWTIFNRPSEYEWGAPSIMF